MITKNSIRNYILKPNQRVASDLVLADKNQQ